MTNADLLALKAELTNNPRNIGLTTNPADDEANSIRLNLIRPIIKVKRRSVSTKAVFDIVVDLEYQAMSPVQQRWFTDFMRLGQFDPFVDVGTMAGLRRIFGASTTTGPKITAVTMEDGSRITELFQAGTISFSQDVTPSDVANARSAV